MIKKIFSIVLVVGIISNCFTFLLIPNPVRASVTSSTAKFSGCATGNIAGTYLSNQLANAVAKLKKKITSVAGKLSKVPVDDSTTQSNIDTTNIQYITKEYVTDVIARCAARVILNAIVGNTYNIMRTNGRDGGVTFVRNWANLQTAAQYRGENIFRAELSTAKLCGYLANDIKKAFGVDPKKQTPLGSKQNTRTDSLQTFGLAVNCTMPADFTTQKYQQDFAGNGGWDTWALMMEPQNNPYGVALLSKDEIQKQRTLQQSADTNQALAGRGYIGTSGKGTTGSCAVKSPNSASCIVYNDIKTTGSYIADSMAASINAELSWITSAQGLGSIIANATEVLLNRLLDQGNPDEGSYREPGDPGIDFSVPSSEIPPSEELCVTDPQKSTLTDIITQALIVRDLNIGDFEDTFGVDRGKFKRDATAAILNKTYTDLYDFEKTITDPTQNEIKNLIQSWETIIRGAAESIKGMQWNTQVEKTDIDRQLTEIKKSISTIKTQADSLIICGSTIPPDGGGEPAVPPPADAGKHGDHTVEVAAARDELIAEGKQFPDPSASDECYRFEIVKRAVPKIGDGAGYLGGKKPGQNNCGGFAVDIIAFPDGYIYDVLIGDKSMPGWNPTGCGTVATNGTCPDLYRAP